MAAYRKKTTVSVSASSFIIVLLAILSVLTACSKVSHNSSELEKRQALSRDDIYTVEIANYEKLEAAMERLNELTASFPQYKSDLHITTIKVSSGEVLYSVRSGVFISNQQAMNYFEKFRGDTGLNDSRLIDAE